MKTEDTCFRKAIGTRTTISPIHLVRYGASANERMGVPVGHKTSSENGTVMTVKPLRYPSAVVVGVRPVGRVMLQGKKKSASSSKLAMDEPP